MSRKRRKPNPPDLLQDLERERAERAAPFKGWNALCRWTTPFEQQLAAGEISFVTHGERTNELLSELIQRQTPPPPPPRYDWEQAALAVFGQVYRGEVPEPRTQADVERLLAEWFLLQSIDGSVQPSDSILREHARKLYKELKIDGQ